MPEETDVKKPMTPELSAAIEKFNQTFAERSYSQRHTDLGKMKKCPRCGMRHREADPVLKNSTAHGEQKKATITQPSITAITKLAKKHRILEHHSARLLQLIELTRKIYHEDIEPYFRPDPEHPERLMLRARRRAMIILRKQWIAERVARKNTQDVSRRINRGLLPGGSR